MNDSSQMNIAAMTFRLRASWVHSLKEKRMIVKNLTAQLQNKFHRYGFVAGKSHGFVACSHGLLAGIVRIIDVNEVLVTGKKKKSITQVRAAQVILLRRITSVYRSINIFVTR